MSFAQLRGASHAPAALAAIAAAILVGACSKGEPQSTKATPNVPLEAPRATADRQRDAGEVDGALKERLARQEAASKLFEKSAPAPAKAPSPEPKPSEAAKAPAPEPRKAEPVKAAAPAAPVSETAKPVSETAKPPTPPPRIEVAAARPAPAPSSSAAQLLSRTDPEFPREAVQAGVDRGDVKARMTLDGSGNVTRVEVVEATPRRLFDRAVVRALSQWKFSDGLSGRTIETEVEFKR
jgi:periplasmic protein TonB